MNNEQILEKAWKIATDRGWEFDNLDKWHLKANRRISVINNWYQFIFTYDGRTIIIDAERIIFDHDFAKALWGDKKLPYKKYEPDYYNLGQYKPVVATTKKSEAWKFHLQQMVIADDPIKYLGEHL